jgi:hypothetical protein
MSQNNMSGSFFPAVAGLFFFMNRTKNEDVYQSEIRYPVYSKDPSGISGVSRYLQNKNASLIAVNLIAEPSELISGVAKYLETLDQFPTSGVEKYILRKDVAEKQKKELSGETEVSGVEKYLKSLKPAKELTGVAKYMKSQSNLPQPSNVAKYLAKQAALSVLQDKPATIQISGVAKYLQLQDSLPQPSRVARYMAKQAAMSALSAMQIKSSTPLTGVAKYLNDQSNQPQISRVAKYMVRQALIEKQKPAPIVTGVEKYMRIQA